MKTIGRIFLAVVGVLLIAFSIPSIISAVDSLNAAGWADISSYPDKIQYLGTIIGQGINALFGLIAVIGALVGKKSWGLALCAIIMIISPIYTLVVGIKNGTMYDWKAILSYVEAFALPIAYFIGFLLV